MNHLESLIAEYLEWQGWFVRRNTRVGRLAQGGWHMELDIVGYAPETGNVVHYEPSIDADSWTTREERYRKKFEAGRQYIRSEIFKWLPDERRIDQIAVLIDHPAGRDIIAGGTLISVDELVAEIRGKVISCGRMFENAIPEAYPLLRTLQLTHSGYLSAKASE